MDLSHSWHIKTLTCPINGRSNHRSAPPKHYEASPNLCLQGLSTGKYRFTAHSFGNDPIGNIMPRSPCTYRHHLPINIMEGCLPIGKRDVIAAIQ
ncbi:hypothetical protein GBA52_015273 [Prunus armeniaca]|nr:hypothetical protein GBA52_015273 [Prunus armeniaca]